MSPRLLDLVLRTARSWRPVTWTPKVMATAAEISERDALWALRELERRGEARPDPSSPTSAWRVLP